MSWRGASLCALLVAIGCDDDRLQPGLPLGAHLDAFRQTSVPKTDILWVIDNSNSMIEEQENLARNFDFFIDYLKTGGVQYHIGVTTTDLQNNAGRLVGTPAVIKWNESSTDPVRAFKDRARVGVGGTAAEEAFGAAAAALAGAPAGFLRPDAYLSIIFLSDEEEETTGDVKYYWRTFEQQRGIGNEGTVAVHAIAGPPGGCPSAQEGKRYQDIAQMTGGQFGSVCQTSFEATMRALGLQTAGLRRKFALTRKPDVETLEVTQRYPCDADLARVQHCEKVSKQCADPAPADRRALVCFPRAGIPNGWVYEDATNSIFFDGTSLPGFDAVIEAVYQEPRAE